MNDIVLQLRYPHTAAIVTIMWLGTATIAAIRNDVALELVLGLLVVATILIASIGFSSPRQ